MDLMQILKALSEETRVRILNLLMVSELCVGEIEYLLNINQSNASRHLTALKNASLIIYEKKAQWIYYRINIDALEQYSFVKNLLENQLQAMDLYNKDKERLKQYKESGKVCSDLKECNANNCSNKK
jgi:ArsR family transcriptional regulator